MVAVAALAAAAPLSALAWGSCSVDLGRGWPPAVGNYGEAVEHLFAREDRAQPVLSLVMLPSHGEESEVALIANDGPEWTLRYARADKRVYNWVQSRNGRGVELQTDQTPEVYEAPIPVSLAQRLVAQWSSALGGMAPAEKNAPVLDGEVASFVVNGVRYSGSTPACGAGELMMKQAALLIEASEDKEKKREKRWEKIESSLDELQQTLAGDAG